VPQYGVPNLDYVDDYPGVILRATLRERALAQSAIYRDPSLELTASVPLHLPAITSYGVGDDVAINITDELMPDGMKLTGTLNEVSINAAEGTADWTITVPQPPPRLGRDYVSGRLNAVDSQLSRIWRAGGRIEPLPSNIEG
jgi:hypothetical protein